MSFILDALRRSERARRVLGAEASAPEVPRAATARRAWFGAIALLLALNAGLLAWFVLRPEATPAPAPHSAPGASRSLAREASSGVAPATAPALGETTAAGVAAEPVAPMAATPLAELEPALRQRLAVLHLDAHGWAEDPAQRFVLIGLKRRVAGDALEGGARLVEVVADGAVIEVDGRRVLLPRQ